MNERLGLFQILFTCDGRKKEEFFLSPVSHTTQEAFAMSSLMPSEGSVAVFYVQTDRRKINLLLPRQHFFPQKKGWIFCCVTTNISTRIRRCRSFWAAPLTVWFLGGAAERFRITLHWSLDLLSMFLSSLLLLFPTEIPAQIAAWQRGLDANKRPCLDAGIRSLGDSKFCGWTSSKFAMDPSLCCCRKCAALFLAVL